MATPEYSARCRGPRRRKFVGHSPLGCRLFPLKAFSPLLRPRGDGRDGGYALQLALITALALFIGTLAFASRTQSGFFGAFAQGENRESRDTAESAIDEFANTMNREPNRGILIAGNVTQADWDAATNPCTQFDSAGTRTSSTPDPIIATDRDRFLPGSGPQDLVIGNSDRRFVVESIEYLANNRATFATAVAANSDFISDIRNGGDRTLIRITVRGQVTRNGRTSTARVAREFEVVPKCCKRSFGSQGARNWGRDTGSCDISENPGGGRGVLGALNGGIVAGSNNTKDIRDENGDLITQAICWEGNGGATPSDLTEDPNPDCATGDLAIGNPDTGGSNTGISFAPDEFGLTLPRYAPVGSAQASIPYNSLSVGNNQNRYIYFNSVLNRVELCQLSGSTVNNCTRLDARTFSTTTPGDPCYVVQAAAPAGTPPAPYPEVNCRLGSISMGNGSSFFIDTTGAKINLFFDDPSLTASSNIISQGNRGFVRVDCRASATLASTPTTNYASGSARCSRAIPWTLSSGDTGLSYQSLCNVSSTDCPLFNASELLNIYASADGRITLNGTTQAVGLNLYAPKADVRLNGGGSAPINFMGRIWSDGLDMDGNIKVRTLSSLPSFCFQGNTCPTGGGTPLFDFMARSFTHSSGF